ncbi:MAG TPA: hypothetical protein DCY13_00985 [Verrucomicrobiales bacterium]|jgi:ATP-dependent Lon protease|nr:hypothetical protein [Verrucomicrobiales bacterium]
MELPDQIGVMILQGATLFPQSMLPLYVFEPRYRRMLQDALDSHRLFCVAMQRPTTSRESPESVAGIGLIRASVRHDNGTSHLILQGLTRVRLDKTVRYKPYRIHRIAPQPTIADEKKAVDNQMDQLRQLIERRLELGFCFPGQGGGSGIKSGTSTVVKPKDILRYLDTLADPEQVADMVACSFLTDAGERQIILETSDLELRLRHLTRYLAREIRRLEKEPPQ